MSKQTECQHLKFVSRVAVFRISQTEGGPITGYSSDISIKCDDCGLPFRFRGVVAGLHPDAPRVSIDGTELRAPLEPAYVVEIAGHPLVSGRA